MQNKEINLLIYSDQVKGAGS